MKNYLFLGILGLAFCINVYAKECNGEDSCSSNNGGKLYPVRICANVEYDLNQIVNFLKYAIHWYVDNNKCRSEKEKKFLLHTAETLALQPEDEGKKRGANTTITTYRPVLIALSTATMGMADPLMYLQDTKWILERKGRDSCNLDNNEEIDIFLMAGHSVFGTGCAYPTFGGGVSFNPSGLEKRFKNEVIGDIPWRMKRVAEFLVSELPNSILAADLCNEENMNKIRMQIFITDLVERIVDDQVDLETKIELIKKQIKSFRKQIKLLQDDLKILEEQLLEKEKLSWNSSKKSKKKLSKNSVKKKLLKIVSNIFNR